ncbi:MAG TPA: low molecular weight protein-tyrosine-phosphatase [Paludibacter sp.]|nr:low molecular weight protein-tyrosine-phosphatase [Paludibacter sp.]
MYSILFVCLGNICRSPIAEGIFNHILEREQAASGFNIDSAGLLGYHEGELADSRMRFHAGKRGYELTHRSRPVSVSDFDRFDMIIGMDEENIAGLKRLAQTSEHVSKIYRMTDFCRNIEATHVPDPYYGGDQGFEHVIDLLEDACEGLYGELKEESLSHKATEKVSRI